MKFCTYCGRKLEDGEQCSCAGTKAAAEETTKGADKGSKKLMKIAIPAVIVIVAVIVIICILAGRGSTFDLNDYLVVEGVSGLNGRGVISYHLDEDALIADMLGTGDGKEVAEDNWESIAAENLEKMEEISAALDCITVTATPEKKLSNGDKVTVSAVFESKAGARFRYRFEDAKQTITVSGLADGKTVDPFAADTVSVTLSGFSGSGEAHLDVLSTDEVMKLFIYKLSAWQGLSNGDTITVSVSFDAAALEEAGYLAPDITERTYTVSGLGEYFDISVGIPNALLQAFCNEALSQTHTLAQAEGGPVTAEPEVIGAFFLSVPDPSTPYRDIFNDVEFANGVAIVTTFTFELEGYGGLFYDRINVWIFPNLCVDGDGKISYDEDHLARYFALGGDPDNMAEWIRSEFWGAVNVSEIPQN